MGKDTALNKSCSLHARESLRNLNESPIGENDFVENSEAPGGVM